MAQTKTLTLVEFLTARLDEDEAAATRHLDDASGAGWGDYPARVLREVAAKRAIVEQSEVSHERAKVGPAPGDGAWFLALRLLAAIYADHPDYREEWRP